MKTEDKTRVCHWCKALVVKEDWCPSCLETFFFRRAPELMSADEREAEFDSLRWAEISFDMIHQRIEALVGRPVWTHELGMNFEGLKKECRWETRPATMQEVIDLIPEEKRIII